MDLSTLDLVTVPLVIGLTEAIKRAVSIDSRYAPVLSVLLAIGVSFIPGVTFDLLTAVIVGLTASGLYDVGTKTVAGK